MKEKFNIKGEHHFFSLPSEVDQKTFELIKKFIRKGDLKAFEKINLINYTCQENLIATVGKAVYTEIMTVGSTATYTGEITDGAIGNGASPVFSATDTQLNNEVYRKTASDAAYDDNIAYIDFFYSSTDFADGTYTEWGTFIDGDGTTANNGVAFSLMAMEIIKSGSIYVASRYTLT